MPGSKPGGLTTCRRPIFVGMSDSNSFESLNRSFHGVTHRIIRFQDAVLQLRPEGCVDGMRHVLIFPTLCLSARHGNKDAVFSLNDFHIVNNEGVIEGDCDVGFQLTVGAYLSDADIRDVHARPPGAVTEILF